jgi:hypothetical protein
MTVKEFLCFRLQEQNAIFVDLFYIGS